MLIYNLIQTLRRKGIGIFEKCKESFQPCLKLLMTAYFDIYTTGHLSKGEMDGRQRNFFQRGNTMCKYPEAKKNMDDLSNCKSRMAGVQEKGKKVLRWIWRNKAHPRRTLHAVSKIYIFIFGATASHCGVVKSVQWSYGIICILKSFIVENKHNETKHSFWEII